MSVGETRVVSSTGGEKGTKLARYDLIPAGALRQVAELYGKGAQKYEDHNWRRGYDWSLSFAAMMRHAWLFWEGEDFDDDPQIPLGDDGERSPHLAAVVFHALTLLTFMQEHPEFDNRPSTRAERERKYDVLLGTEPTREERFQRVAEAYKSADPILAGIYADTVKEWQDVTLAGMELIEAEEHEHYWSSYIRVDNDDDRQYRVCRRKMCEARKYLEVKPREPRVWDQLKDIPPGVCTTDVYGNFWESLTSGIRMKYRWGSDVWYPVNSQYFDEYSDQVGPFTEVLEPSEAGRDERVSSADRVEEDK